MNVLFRCRIDKKALAQANRVAEQLGTSTPEMVRIFVTQIARTGRVPLTLDPKAKPDDALAGPWFDRAARLESFYDPAKNLVTSFGSTSELPPNFGLSSSFLEKTRTSNELWLFAFR